MNAKHEDFLRRVALKHGLSKVAVEDVRELCLAVARHYFDDGRNEAEKQKRDARV